jgi:glycosyltransferase involved in cell wall biosynthesis
MPGNPNVSIIIPNYNYARYLEQRFQSILAQTYRDYEVIFLDDASTDNSVNLVQERFSPYITQMEVNTVNSGNPFVQWNRRVRLSRGKYVWIAEADDLCAPGFLERAVQVMDNNPSVGLVYCNTSPIDGDGTVLDEDFYHKYVSDLDPTRWRHDFTAPGLSEARNYLARKNTITNVSGVLFRREAYIQAGYAPEDMRMCGDWMTYCHVLQVTDIGYLSTPLNFHRQHIAKHSHNSVLNLTYFREFLMVQQYAAEVFDLDKPAREEAFQRFLREWDRLTISHYGRIGLSGTRTLARMTRQAYPGPAHALQITAHLLLNSLKSFLARGLWP